MIAPDGLRTNAYRVLRLPASATASEIHKAAASMRRAVALGIAGTTDVDLPELGEVPRSEADIRTALGRLANPQQRLTDRLFWFFEPPHSADTVTSSGSPESSRHDQVLGRLFGAIERGIDDSTVWVSVLRAWSEIVNDDDYWAVVLAHEEEGEFEPAAIFSEVEAVRDEAVRLAADSLVLAGRAALASDDLDVVRRILVALAKLDDTGSWAAVALDDIAAPAVERFEALCESVRGKYGSRVIREQDAGSRNKPVCDDALKYFRADIQPALNRIIGVLPQDHHAAQRIRESGALCLSGIATDYTWADDFVSSETLNQEALSLARDTLGAIRIQERLSEVQGAAQKQRVFGGLKPISSAPTLWTLNGFGFKLYGQTDPDPETNSYLTTYYLVALFVPVFPLTRYRVIGTAGNGYRFLGKAPLRKADRWHLGIAAVVVSAIIFGIAMSPEQSSAKTSSQAVRSRPSSSQTSQLENLKTRIEQRRSENAALEAQLQPVITTLTELNAQLESLSSELKALDEQQKGGLEIDIDDYNAKVERHNRILARRKALLAKNRNDLQKYDDFMKEDSALVEQYNSLLKGAGQ